MIPPSIFGLWTKCTFNTVRVAGCGSRPKPRTLCCSIIRRAAVWDISARSACETDKFNALACWQFLKHLRAAGTRAGRRVGVTADNARFHHARLHAE